jgi:hypothetical protein
MAEGLIVRKGSSSAEVTSLSFVTSTSAGSVSSINLPSGILAGDLIVYASLETADGDDQTTNFTNIDDFACIGQAVQGGDNELAVFYKVANGTESGRSIQTVVSSANNVVAIFRGNIPITIAMPVVRRIAQSTGAPATQTVNLVGREGTYLAIAVNAASNAVTSNTSITMSTVTTGGSTMIFKYKIYNAADTKESFTVAQPDNGNNSMASAGIWIK